MTQSPAELPPDLQDKRVNSLFLPTESTNWYGSLRETAEAFDGVPAPESQLFVSRMRMHSQETTPSVLEYERAIIADELKLSAVDEITFDDEGWDSRVYLVHGGEIVYKFPRSPEVIAGYAKEIAAIKLVESLTGGVMSQSFREAAPGNQYFSYKGIVGTQLSELLDTLSIPDKQRIGLEIGSFLKRLHYLQLVEAPVVTPADETAEYQAKYRLATPVIEANFSTSEQSMIAALFEERMPTSMKELGSELRLCHGDLGAYNIIIDSAGKSGIIDFGNIGYYDQSKDFIDFGDITVLQAALQAYGTSSRLEAKVAIRMLALPAIDLVYYMNKLDNHGIEKTIQQLRLSLMTMSNLIQRQQRKGGHS